jgi:thiol-disulfide isomerase/thioredoxin
MKKIIIITVITTLLFSCKTEKKQEKLLKGKYRATLKLTKTKSLPFNFEVVNENKIKIFNAKEVIEVTDIEYKNDSVYINMPVFTSYFVAKVTKGLLNGTFVKKDLNRFVPFTSIKNDKRFDVTKKATINITGNWETTFSPDSDKDKYIAKGIFTQNGNIVTGTFRTTTGDYRYLEGVMQGNQLKLSTLDGAHAFLFTATISKDKMKGTFYSGNHWSEPFIAIKNENFTLPSANNLTKIKKNAKKFAFAFPDQTGKIVSLSDHKFKNKVTIVQIFGTWCPNCLDESRYYSNYYKKNKNKDIEFVALAFEYVKTKEKAFEFIKKFKKDLKIEYPILLAQIGSTSKTKAQEKLPMLDKVRSYPTTIFLDRKGKVRKIHTGFNGPATGQLYLDYKKEFEEFVDELLNE